MCLQLRTYHSCGHRVIETIRCQFYDRYNLEKYDGRCIGCVLDFVKSKCPHCQFAKFRWPNPQDWVREAEMVTLEQSLVPLDLRG